jgi:hypothetical protein
MTTLQRLRLPALFCCLAFLLCVIVTHPSAEMGICDDWSYILTAQKLAATGHLQYNGWATAMLGWQLYLGAAFVRLFGFSFTVVRMSTLFVAVLTAFFIHRTLARVGLSARTATIGTLAIIFSPVYMMLSVTFMSDIQGLFALVLCLYSCLRALQATAARSITAWICCAVFANTLCGSARQIAWLGVLVMVPCTLWLLRSRRSVLFIGIAANLIGALCIFAAMQWFKHQLYSIPEHLLPKSFTVMNVLWSMVHLVLDIPFLILPLAALFLPELRKYSRRTLALFAAFAILYFLATRHLWHINPNPLLEPALFDWVNVHGIFEGVGLFGTGLFGTPPIFLPVSVQIVLTVVSVASLFCILASLLRSRTSPGLHPDSASSSQAAAAISTRQLAVLLGPFTAAYLVLLIPRANESHLVDRYLLPLLVLVAIILLRFYQTYIHPRIPAASLVLIGVYAIYSIAVTHNLFSFYRARIDLATELHSAGIPDTAVDTGWEQDAWVELQYAPNINDSRIINPANAYTHMRTRQSGQCSIAEAFPHITPRYAISFDPNACQGPTAFAPVHYSRWLASQPGTLYVVADKLPPPQPAP